MKLLLALAWFLISAGLAPVGLGRGHEVRLAGAPRAISAAEHRVDLPRPGERAAADWQAGRTRAPGGHAPGGIDLLPAAPRATIAGPAEGRQASSPATAARIERPRRMRFPTEATAPPAALS